MCSSCWPKSRRASRTLLTLGMVGRPTPDSERMIFVWRAPNFYSLHKTLLISTWPAVAALLALLGSTSNHGGRMASWTPGKDPCGAANCTAAASQGFPQYPTTVLQSAENASAGNSCQWAGISCM